MQELINYTLPEFAFLDANLLDVDDLENRTVVLHTRSASVFEIIHLDEIMLHQLNCKQWHFEFINPKYAMIESITFALHYSFAPEDLHNEIALKLKEWYFKYLIWEDKNL